MTVTAEAPVIKAARQTGFVWLDLTRKCQLQCHHCHNHSGPGGTHGTMTTDDWTRVLDECAAAGIPHVQFTGGEVTMHPDAPALIEHALTLGLKAEVYSNMVRLDTDWWTLLRRQGVSLATSYYGGEGRHNAVTGRPSHARTRANIVRAVEYGIPLRVSVIVADPSDTGDPVKRDLQALGVRDVRVDHVRPFGRAADSAKPCTDGLCGRCGDGRASISPYGQVSPCVFSTWMGVGNVQDTPLTAILGGPEMAEANATIRQGRSLGVSSSCGPNSPCGPDNQDKPCSPDTDDECSPGTPRSECTPRN
ncbi:radical SAM/SPASM domain-containing protein [Streptomyces sp. NPDC048665]|uniref:radical SAM/SPASM domain-containing protein n=1 Tax=Streptomyces sp. NPDC048665 TaxID=3155490 RepID=UPI0034295459